MKSVLTTIRKQLHTGADLNSHYLNVQINNLRNSNTKPTAYCTKTNLKSNWNKLPYMVYTFLLIKLTNHCGSAPLRQCHHISYSVHRVWGDYIYRPSSIRFDYADLINSCCSVQIWYQLLAGCTTDWANFSCCPRNRQGAKWHV